MLRVLSFLLLVSGCGVTERSSVDSPTPRILESPIVKNDLLKHFETLSSDTFLGRKAGSLGNKLAREYITTQLHNSGVSPIGFSYFQDFQCGRCGELKKGTNVVGIINGTEFTEKYIVITAHYDHIGTKAGKIFNGADDNASGVAALLSLASTIQALPLRYTVVIVFTDAEEINLNGAKSFVKQNPTIIENTVLNVNLDMISGSNRTKKLHLLYKRFSNILSKSEIEQFKEMQNSASINTVIGFKKSRSSITQRRDWNRASDHGAFYRAGLPFIYYGVGEHNNYHQPSDNFENANIDLFVRAAYTIYHQLIFLDQRI